MTVPWPKDLTIAENVGASLATGDLSTIIGQSQTTGLVNAVKYTPAASVTGAATNNRVLTLFNRGNTTGAGTLSVASLTLASGTDLTDNAPATITLSTTAANLTINVGDTLEWVSQAVSSGLADPGGRVVVTFAQTN